MNKYIYIIHLILLSILRSITSIIITLYIVGTVSLVCLPFAGFHKDNLYKSISIILMYYVIAVLSSINIIVYIYYERKIINLNLKLHSFYHGIILLLEVIIYSFILVYINPYIFSDKVYILITQLKNVETFDTNVIICYISGIGILQILYIYNAIYNMFYYL